MRPGNLKTLNSQFFILLVISAIIIALSSCGEDRVATVAKAIKQVEDSFAVDSRLARYDVKLAGSGRDFVIRGETTEEDAIDALKEKLDSLGVTYEFKVDLLPMDSATYKYGLVNVSVANVRSYRRHSNELVTQAWLGYPMKILKTYEDWYMVQGPDDYIGYMDKLSLTRLSDAEYANWSSAPKWFCTTPQTWLYQSPESDEVLMDLVMGDLAVYVSDEENFVKLQTPDGKTGYARKDEGIRVSEWLKDLNPKEEDIIAAAESMMGVPYLWGGTSTKGVDCSGFTRTVFARYGYLLERDASLQVKTGIKLPLDSTFASYKPGDLFFFGTEGVTKNFISHVAIYMGNGKIIHATGKVKVESLKKGDPDFAKDRYDTWLEARRILGAGEEEGVTRFTDLPYLTIDN